MLLTPFASSSAGNLYQVYDGHTRILLECGLSIGRMQQLLPCPLSAYDACLITHEHKDHSRSAGALMQRGMDVYMTQGTADGMRETENPRAHIVSIGKQFGIGTLRVKPFPTVHDCAEPCGYLIHSDATGERLVFATDTAFLKHRFPGLSEIAVECNHSAEQIERSKLPQVVKQRAKRTHMALESCCVWLAGLDLKRVERIWLVHLSAMHADAQGFPKTVQDVTGVHTVVCDAQREIHWR